MIIVPTKPFYIVLFLIASSSLFLATNAQPTIPRAVHDTSNQPFMILLVIIAIAFFITGFFSFYIRHCSETYLVSGTTSIAQKGLDPQVLATFPVTFYSTVKTGRNAALQCALCLSEFGDFDKLRLLPKCSLVFHPSCIDAWLASHVTCPVCRANLNEDCAEIALEIEHENVVHQVFDESAVRSGNGSCGGNEGGVRGNVDGCIGKDNGSSKMRGFGVLVRSHSTGHSLIELHKKDMERFTLRLSEEVKKQILDEKHAGNMMMKRSASYGFLQGEEGCSGKGWWGRSEGGEGSSKGKNKGWVLSMTPPFVSRGFLSSSGVTQNAPPLALEFQGFGPLPF